MTLTAGQQSHRARVDTAALKLAYPIEEVVQRYGIEVRRQGRTLVGRCPFHADSGRPNLHLFGQTQTWFCFRCGIGGDCLKFVMLIEDVGFVDAVARLDGSSIGTVRVPAKPMLKPAAMAIGERNPEELAALQTAVTLYHHALLAEPRAMAYVSGRGLDRSIVDQFRLGYAAGDQLAAYLRWQRLPIGSALQAGLFTHGGVEFLAGRIVVPQLRAGQAVWAIGRLLGESPDENVPIHLGLPGPKPLLGIDELRDCSTVLVLEGTFDYLTLRMWGYPVVAVLGTHLREDLIQGLHRFNRQFLVLDNDDAGLEATLHLQEQLGASAIPVALPDGIKDPSQLATLTDGRELFATALLEAAGLTPVGPPTA